MQIKTEKQLRKVIKPYNKMLDKRVQSQLDQLSMEYITASRLAALFMPPNINYIEWDHESLIVHSPTSFSIACNQNNQSSTPLSLYLIIPGIGHGLRINGFGYVTNGRLTLDITAIYFQCARAATRSSIWEHYPEVSSTGSLEQFVASSRFCFIGTQNKQGMTELSPRGEANQAITLLNANQILLAERPGNKVAISLRNILQDPNISLSLLRPGSLQSVLIKGHASLTSNPELLNRLSVKNKVPPLALLIDVTNINLIEELAFSNQNIWDSKNYRCESDLTPFSKAINQHMNGEGLWSMATEKIVKGVIKKDMNNLY